MHFLLLVFRGAPRRNRRLGTLLSQYFAQECAVPTPRAVFDVLTCRNMSPANSCAALTISSLYKKYGGRNTHIMKLSRFSIGTGDRFGMEGEAQIAAFQQLREHGGEADIVWNKSNREHAIIGSTPAKMPSMKQ
jgi:hypothetical protein